MKNYECVKMHKNLNQEICFPKSHLSLLEQGSYMNDKKMTHTVYNYPNALNECEPFAIIWKPKSRPTIHKNCLLLFQYVFIKKHIPSLTVLIEARNRLWLTLLYIIVELWLWLNSLFLQSADAIFDSYKLPWPRHAISSSIDRLILITRIWVAQFL